MADNGEQLRPVWVGEGGDQRPDPVAQQREAQVEQGGAAADPQLTIVRVGHREPAVRIHEQLDDVPPETQPPRLRVVQRRRLPDRDEERFGFLGGETEGLGDVGHVGHVQVAIDVRTEPARVGSTTLSPRRRSRYGRTARSGTDPGTGLPTVRTHARLGCTP